MKDIFIRFPIWARWVLGILLSLVIVATLDHRTQIRQEQQRKMIAAYTYNHLIHAYKFIDNNQIDSAISRINIIDRQYLDTTTRKADSLLNMIQYSQSQDFALNQLLTMTDAEINQLKKGSYSKQFLPNSQLNKNFTILLTANIAKRREYIRKAKAEEKVLIAEKKRNKLLALKDKERKARLLALNKKKRKAELLVLSKKKRRSNANSYSSSEHISSSSGYIRGPRGGCYYINSNGNKTYVDRSLCN